MTKVYFTFLLFLPVLSFSQISMIELDAKKVPEPLARDTVVDNWNSLQPGFRLLNQQAKEMLYWTNYCRNNPQKFWDSAALPILKTFPKLKKTEAESMRLDILHAGQLPMFSLNANLITTAQAHAFDIARRKAPLSHNSTNGADFGTRMKNAGIKQCANENIALSSQSVLLSVMLLYLDIGISSQGHRKALLDPNLRETGVGASLYGVDQYFLVQDFACSQ
jgi:hypothetical protein